MMKFKMNKLTTAVAVGLGVSAAGMNTAHSDEILFPQLVVSPTVTTIVTVVNDIDASFEPVDERLEYDYFHKPPVNSAACNSVDFLRTTSANDVVTFDAGGMFGDNLGVLFEPPQSQVNANYQAAGLSFAGLRNITQPARAFLLVNNNRFFPGGRFEDLFDNSLYGEAIVLEFGQGAAWGYRAYNADNDFIVSPEGPIVRDPENLFDFADDEETAGEVLVGDTRIHLLPFIEAGGEFNTRFMVTPVSDFQRQGGLSTAIALATDDPTTGRVDVMFDRDENPVSGSVAQSVVCVGAVPAVDLLSQGALGELLTGGWSRIFTFDGNTNGQAVVFKLEFNQDIPAGTGTFDGESVPGVFNNAVWLRKGHRESVGGSTVED